MKKLILIFFCIVFFQLYSAEKVGLALSGGGARGLAHIGVLKVFDQENIKVDYISGTSSGALIASLYACGYSALEIEQMFLDLEFRDNIDSRISRNKKQIRFKHWQDDSSFSFRLYDNFIPMLPESITAGNRMINQIAMMMWDCWIEEDFDDLNIPLRITATDILTGEPEVFSKGSLHEAIYASFCFPTILKPFYLNGSYYIDGGIRSNLPLEPLLATDADFLIGVKVNSPLKQSENINNVVDILEQTAGIAIKSNVQKSLEFCDLLIMPELDDWGMLDFNKADSIISAGEEAARKMLLELKKLPKRDKKRNGDFIKNRMCRFDDIRVEGNINLQKKEILRYLELEKNRRYSKNDIKNAFENAYNSELFQLIYPVVQNEGEKIVLVAKVKEKMRSHLSINPVYNSDEGISLIAFSSHKNLIQDDSSLLVALKVSQNTQFSFDYIKNFGNDYGLYLHLYPYIQEVPLYSYDEENMKTNSVRALETGETSGVGFFFRKSLSLELYNFAYHKKLYRDIGTDEISQQTFTSQGIGAKLYFETLDDLIFAKKGVQLLSKIYVANSKENAETTYKRSLHKFQFIHPVTNRFSLRYRFEYGSYFEEMVPHDPFYIGGIDSFLGLNKYEYSASIYKINSFSIRINPVKNLFIEALVNSLNLGNSDSWAIDDDLTWGGGLIAGYKTPLGPLRGALAIMEDRSLTGYLSIGYDLDVFEFSKR